MPSLPSRVHRSLANGYGGSLWCGVTLVPVLARGASASGPKVPLTPCLVTLGGPGAQTPLRGAEVLLIDHASWGGSSNSLKGIWWPQTLLPFIT